MLSARKAEFTSISPTIGVFRGTPTLEAGCLRSPMRFCLQGKPGSVTLKTSVRGGAEPA
eukprot:CAMPEP_0115732516 /NCGR_PEP_ID=MMETSP0272-20121206/85165_1 /TAXON_ID=71861 /ORGANISM="Scrippsiella trochoidea, Strain CCMP3099" /LENGTH=58 /DNA_ID=CAMNT_0003176435 /DNA_START=151 /DNA_END=323 /DNA_ORIENTATION=+